MIATDNLRFEWVARGRSSPQTKDSSPKGLFFADLSVSPQGLLLLRGPSGSGKSTLLGLLAGLLTPSSGRVVVAGQDLAQLKPAARDAWRGRSLGFLPQRLHLDPALTVLGNVLLPGFAAGVPLQPARGLEVLAQLGVADLAHRQPQALSVGQAQRVALARAVVLRPQVLLADEPTASLDDAAAADVLSLLLNLAATSQTTLVVATHDARVVQALSQARPDAVTVNLPIPTGATP